MYIVDNIKMYHILINCTINTTFFFSEVFLSFYFIFNNTKIIIIFLLINNQLRVHKNYGKLKTLINKYNILGIKVIQF